MPIPRTGPRIRDWLRSMREILRKKTWAAITAALFLVAPVAVESRQQLASAAPEAARDFYFAEGTIRPGFSETLAIANPTAAAGSASVTFMFPGGATYSMSRAVDAYSRVSIDVASFPQVRAMGPDLSARVTTPLGWVAERQMLFDYGPGLWTGGHDKVGVGSASKTWYFAEGTSQPGFSEFLTIQNPNSFAVAETIVYQPEGCVVPGGLSREFTVAPFARETISVTDPGDPRGVRGATCVGVGAFVSSSAPVVAERPEYFNYAGYPMGEVSDGHVAFGATAPATSWFFAEGTTLPPFKEYLTLANPGADGADVTLDYQVLGGLPVQKIAHVAAGGRRTIDVADLAEGVGPGRTGVSVHLTSTRPLVAERPMYLHNDWGFGPIGGGHDTLGALAPGLNFGFATGHVGPMWREYLTIQNPGPVPATATIAYIGASGDAALPKPLIRKIDLPALSRTNVEVFGASAQGGVGPLEGDHDIATTIASSAPILVERPQYFIEGSATGASDAVGDQSVAAITDGGVPPPTPTPTPTPSPSKSPSPTPSPTPTVTDGPLKVLIKNDSGRPDSDIFVALQGGNPGANAPVKFVRDAKGTNRQYAVPLTSLPVVSGGSQTVRGFDLDYGAAPGNSVGSLIWLAFGNGSDPNLEVYPTAPSADWASAVGKTRFANVEQAYVAPTAVNQGDTTYVNQYSIPMDIESCDASGQNCTGLYEKYYTDCVVSAVNAEVVKSGGTFSGDSGVAHFDANGNFIRITSPDTNVTGWPLLNGYVNSLPGQTFKITGSFGTISSTGSKSTGFPSEEGYYDYTGTTGTDGTTRLTGTVGRQINGPSPSPGRPGDTITITRSELIPAIYNQAGNYTATGPDASTPNNNDAYNAIFADFVTGLTYGYWGGKYGNDNSVFGVGSNLPYAAARPAGEGFLAYSPYSEVLWHYSNAYNMPYGERYHSGGHPSPLLDLKSGGQWKITIHPDTTPGGCAGSWQP